MDYGYGGQGNDAVYGTDAADVIVGDDYNKPDTEGIIVADDTMGGDDVLKGYGGDDLILGNFGDDLIDGGAGIDLLYGHFGDDVIYGGDGDDKLYGDDN